MGNIGTKCASSGRCQARISPGQIETENKKALVKGIPYLEKDVEMLNEFADKYGITPLAC